jgi:hypothetical protein
VAADALGSVPRHDADDERPGDRHEDDERAEVMAGGRDERGVDALKEEKIRKETDELQQSGGDEGGEHADEDREPGNRQDAARRREIAEVIERAGAVT